MGEKSYFFGPETEGGGIEPLQHRKARLAGITVVEQVTRDVTASEWVTDFERVRDTLDALGIYEYLLEAKR